MNIHKNARLTPLGRGRIAMQVLSGQTPEAVARAGYRGMKRGARVVLPGLSTKFLALAGELPPRRVALEINRLLLREA